MHYGVNVAETNIGVHDNAVRSKNVNREISEDGIDVFDSVMAVLGHMGLWVSWTTQLAAHFMIQWIDHAPTIFNEAGKILRSAVGDPSEWVYWWDRDGSDSSP